MTLTKKIRILLVGCILLFTQTQTAFASERYASVEPGESVEISNGDGTNTYCFLDPIATAQVDFNIDSQWWSMVYETVGREVQRLAPTKYAERNGDIILLLHSRPMDHLKIEAKRFRLADGRIVTAGQLDEEQALWFAPSMFSQPEVERDYFVLGWFYWGRNGNFDIMALADRDYGETTIHELAHAFTNFETSAEEREAIAESVVKSLFANEDFVARFVESSLPPHLGAPEAATIKNF